MIKVILIFAVGIVFVLLVLLVYFSRKALEAEWRREDQERHKKSQYPSYEEVVGQYRREKVEAVKKAFSIVESIQNQEMKQAALDTLRFYGVTGINSKYPVSGKTIIEAVMVAARESDKLCRRTPAEIAKAKKRLSKLISDCDLALRNVDFNDANYHLLTYWRNYLVSLETVRMSDFESGLFISKLEQDIVPLIREVICRDCLQKKPRYCKYGHCLNCSSKSQRHDCIECVKALGIEVCSKCQTIKPVRAENGECLSCLKSKGYDVCLDCGTISPKRYPGGECSICVAKQGLDFCLDCETVNPKRCIKCHECLVCNSDYGGDMCSSCYWAYWD